MTRSKRWALLSAAALLLAPWSISGEASRTRGDPAARLSAAPDATEYWEVTARFDGGYRLFTRFGITNEGPGERTAGAIWYLVHPDGHVSELRNGREQGNWKLSPDHLRLDIASSSLDLRAPLRRLAIDSTSQHAKLNLQFPAGDTPADSPAGAFQTDTLQLAAPMEGTIWVRGMPAPTAVRGTAALTHTWTDDSLPRIVQRQIEFVADTTDLAFYLSDVTTPGGTSRRWLEVQPSGATAYQSTDFELLLGGANPATTDGTYPVPGQLLIRDDRITLDIRVERLLLRTNPLDVVPQPFRLLFSLKIAPQWVWADASFHLTLSTGAASPPIEAGGQGILAVNFMNPLPLPK
jgi:hypothetical protein